MRINYIGKGVVINEALQDWLEKKTKKLDKYLRDNTDVQVKLSQQKSNLNIAEITIHLDGAILRVEESTEDMYTSIDKAVEKTIRQIRKHRTKLDKRLRSGAFEVADDFADVAEEATHELVRTKKFTMKPMSVEDAIQQMELLGHSFFMFIDDETGGTCVVYVRGDGNYGMLAPDNA